MYPIHKMVCCCFSKQGPFLLFIFLITVSILVRAVAVRFASHSLETFWANFKLS